VISLLQRPLPDNTHNRQTSMPPVRFEPTISAGERPQTYALHRAATETAQNDSIHMVNSCRLFGAICSLHLKGSRSPRRVALVSCTLWQMLPVNIGKYAPFTMQKHSCLQRHELSILHCLTCNIVAATREAHKHAECSNHNT
jgi:hypothetical protein